RLSEEEPVLAGLLKASVMDIAVTGERAGRRIRRVLSDPAPGQRTGELCFASRGFSLHAARRVRPEQTNKLEELCRYVLRPPLANHRLRWLGDDELLLALKRKWDDGTTHILLSASELLGRLAALVPPKGFNLTRYHGCLAPRSSIRNLIVPAPSAPDDPWKAPTGGRARPRRG
ncbi:MAG: transposase, partial [Pseudomonadota bacterium]